MENKDLPAFPIPVAGFGGLTKREYFAAKAMQGLLASSGTSAYPDMAIVAEKSAQYANALLSELSIETTES